MLELSRVAEVKSLEPQVQAHLILEIDGIDEVFGAYPVKRIPRIGDKGLLVGDDWKIGQVLEIPESRPYINLTGSSQQLSQQLEQDKGGSGSIGSLIVELIDKNDTLTELVSKQVLVDLLYRQATVYFAFKDTEHPTDSVRILSGVITDIKAKIGSYVLTIQHPEALKKTSLFVPGNSQTVGAITSSANEIIIEDGREFPTSWTPFVKIDDEWIQYFDIEKLSNDTWKISNLVRGSRGTTAAAHDSGADITSGVRVRGNLIDLSLQLMLSGGDDSESVDIHSVNQVTNTQVIQNTILFTTNVKERFGLVVGDLVSLSNEIGYRFIDGFGETFLGYYLVLSGSYLETNTTPEITAKFRSKFNINADGCGIPQHMVDIEEHIKIKSLYGNAFFDYDFFITEEIEAQELINEQIYFPAGLYQLPRQGKISLGLTRAPLADNAIKIDSSNILNAQELTIQRSVNKYFYNSVVYKFEKMDDEDKYLSASIHYSADSQNKIKIGNKTLEIKCQGIHKFDGLKRLMDSCATRFLNRYQFAADFIPKVVVNFKTGFRIDVGDCVLFGGPDLRLADMRAGTRSFEPRLMEVVNKRLDLKTGKVELDLLDTNFEEDGRYGVIAPSGVVSSFSQNVLTFGKWPLSANKTAKQVWGNYIGQHIEWHNDDWSRSGTGEIASFSALSDDAIELVNVTGQAAQNGDIVSPMRYSPSEKVDRTFKRIFCYVNPTAQVVSGISSTKFTVSNSYLPFFSVGSHVLLHKEDWSQKTEEVKVLAINGNEITTAELGLIPDNTFKIELIGFADGGAPYRII